MWSSAVVASCPRPVVVDLSSSLLVPSTARGGVGVLFRGVPLPHSAVPLYDGLVPLRGVVGVLFRGVPLPHSAVPLYDGLVPLRGVGVLFRDDPFRSVALVVRCLRGRIAVRGQRESESAATARQGQGGLTQMSR